MRGLLGALALLLLVQVVLAMTATLRQRQDTLHIFPTTPVAPPTSTAARTSWYTPTPTPMPTALSAASTVPISPSMGLVLPRAFPYDHIYVGAYKLGWLEVAPANPPIVGGWMRMVSPAVVLPDYSVHMLNVTGSEDPRDPHFYPVADPMCGSYAVTARVNTYDYTFTRTGWHMLVVNQTWMRPTITNNGTCQLPLVDTQSFFATALISIAPLPTVPPVPRPTGAHTTWLKLSTELPWSLPPPPKWGRREQIAAGLVIGLSVTAALVGVLLMLRVKRRRFLNAERHAFNHMRPELQEEFLRDNPQSALNPNRQPSGLALWVRKLRADIADQRARRAATAVHKPLPPLPPRDSGTPELHRAPCVPETIPLLHIQPAVRQSHVGLHYHAQTIHAPPYLGGSPPIVLTPMAPPLIIHPPIVPPYPIYAVQPPYVPVAPAHPAVWASQGGSPRRFSR
ncbi:hypothetical protein CC85DRAFT_282071 [Cutaneotrichosporon oleaginosum]|uniref:Uncharacterized protein n=1 Tax=Cutaneotrichosporon oleaginosum TaxID=879819 RepID=A0A0J0XY12_9TREE|nr:uncharacterized protein CC85DRAFT_282071 [Cutaneotrichosporon oleaginosum]KLT45928.1 hypothetical protein CC85DRAFT_282071 [Cutaneotrichosporon oleaginosum]